MKRQTWVQIPSSLHYQQGTKLGSLSSIYEMGPSEPIQETLVQKADEAAWHQIQEEQQRGNLVTPGRQPPWGAGTPLETPET